MGIRRYAAVVNAGGDAVILGRITAADATGARPTRTTPARVTCSSKPTWPRWPESS